MDYVEKKTCCRAEVSNFFWTLEPYRDPSSDNSETHVFKKEIIISYNLIKITCRLSPQYKLDSEEEY